MQYHARKIYYTFIIFAGRRQAGGNVLMFAVCCDSGPDFGSDQATGRKDINFVRQACGLNGTQPLFSKQTNIITAVQGLFLHWRQQS